MKKLASTIAVASLLALGACGERVIDTAGLEGQIATELEAQTGVTPASVECPEDVPVQQGATFDCTVTADDGSSATVVVTQTDDEGGVKWEVQG